MRKFLVVALAMLLAGAADVSAQGLLKRLGKAVKKEVVNQVTTAVNGSGSGSHSQAEQPQQQTEESSWGEASAEQAEQPTEQVEQPTQQAVAQNQNQAQNKSSNVKDVNNDLQPVTSPMKPEPKRPETGTTGGHAWVDMGLPSGTLWATCNIGATSPEQPGGHYAWGEVATKSSYTESNSKTYDQDLWEISNDKSSDVAAAKWGNGWRMPTNVEFAELLRYGFAKYEKVGGRYAHVITSVINGRSIVLPAAGCKDGTSTSNATTCGNYWTSTADGFTGAFSYHYGAALGEMGGASRYYGNSVRAVLSKPDHIDCPASGETNGHAWVDLGLPSGTKWATCNIGAEYPDANGLYFAWGEPKDIATPVRKRNSLHLNRDIKDITANPAYDAATAQWGDGWQIPTKAQMVELANNCDWEVVTMSGRYGFRITSRINGNWIFLPAAGSYGSSSLRWDDFPNDDDEHCFYWTSSVEPYLDWGVAYNSYSLREMSINKSTGFKRPHIMGVERNYARPIRPVMVK